MFALRARSSTVRGWSRRSSTQGSGAPSGWPSRAGTGAVTNWAWPPARCGGTTSRRAAVLATANPWSRRTRGRQRSSAAALLEIMREVGAVEQVITLVTRTATDVALDDPTAVADLLEIMREVGAAEQVTVLATRAATDLALDDLAAVAHLLKVLRGVAAAEQVTTLAARFPAVGRFSTFVQFIDHLEQFAWGESPMVVLPLPGHGPT